MDRYRNRQDHPVAKARLDKNPPMRQIELAVRAGVSEKTIRNIESGISPHRATQIVVAEALGKPVSQLWPPLRQPGQHRDAA